MVFADMSRSCVIFSKLLVHRFAEMYKEYNNIVIILYTTLILFFKEKESKEFKVFAADACVVCQNFLFLKRKAGRKRYKRDIYNPLFLSITKKQK